MSKAQKIRELYASGLGTRQIADKVGCKIEYVRVAARQRVGRPHGLSKADERYLLKKWKALDAGEANQKKLQDRRSRRRASA